MSQSKEPFIKSALAQRQILTAIMVALLVLTLLIAGMTMQ